VVVVSLVDGWCVVFGLVCRYLVDGSIFGWLVDVPMFGLLVFRGLTGEEMQ